MIQMEILENPPYSNSFEEVFRIRHRLLKLFTDEKYPELAATVSKIPETDPNLTALKIIWEVMLAAEQGDLDVVEANLAKGVQQGIWFSKTVLGDFASKMIDTPHLENLIGQHQDMYSEIKENTAAQLIIRTPKNYTEGKKFPVILFLDGRHSDHRISEFYWKPALELVDVIFASLRSSQRKGFAQFVWDDKETALQEVMDAFNILRNRSDVDESAIIVSGMSQGSSVAIYSIASDLIPAKGFITIAQALNPDSFFGQELPTLVGKRVKGVIISGEKDTPRQSKHKEFYELAKSKGITMKCIT
jgi:predicted peptidase